MRKLMIAVFLALPPSLMAATPQTVTLDVKNMTCPVCPITVKKALEKVSGVSAVKVDFAKKSVIVTFDPDKTKPDALTRATTDAGFPSTLEK